MATKKNAAGETPEAENNNMQEKKERKPRTAKVKYQDGSPHDILFKFIASLSPTEADYLNRHINKKALKDEHPDGNTSFEGELFNGVRSKLQ